MRASAYQQLMDDLEKLDAPEASKQIFAALIRSHAAQNGIASIERQDRVDFARRLLDLHVERSVIAERLQRTYGIGRSQAYEYITRALQIVRKTTQKPDGNGVK